MSISPLGNIFIKKLQANFVLYSLSLSLSNTISLLFDWITFMKTQLLLSISPFDSRYAAVIDLFINLWHNFLFLKLVVLIRIVIFYIYCSTLYYFYLLNKMLFFFSFVLVYLWKRYDISAYVDTPFFFDEIKYPEWLLCLFPIFYSVVIQTV